MPFAGYPDFKACVKDNQDKKDPEAFCAYLENKTKENQMQTRSVIGIPMFTTGNHNGDPYSEQDLDNIVHAFGCLKGKIKPPLKLGHSSDKFNLDIAEKMGILPEMIAGENGTGAIAFGYVNALRRHDQILYADVEGVPEAIADLIKAKSYGNVSAEILFDMQDQSDLYPRVLVGLALLGAELPAVKGADLQKAAIYAIYSSKPTKEYVISGELSLDDKRSLIQSALGDAFGKPMEQPTMPSPWIRDLYEGFAIVSIADHDFKIPYSMDASGKVTFGEPIMVVRQTIYEPVAGQTAQLSMEALTKEYRDTDGTQPRDERGRWSNTGAKGYPRPKPGDPMAKGIVMIHQLSGEELPGMWDKWDKWMNDHDSDLEKAAAKEDAEESMSVVSDMIEFGGYYKGVTTERGVEAIISYGTGMEMDEPDTGAMYIKVASAPWNQRGMSTKQSGYATALVKEVANRAFTTRGIDKVYAGLVMPAAEGFFKTMGFVKGSEDGSMILYKDKGSSLNEISKHVDSRSKGDTKIYQGVKRMETIIKALGLDEKATPEQAVEAIEKLKESSQKVAQYADLEARLKIVSDDLAGQKKINRIAFYKEAVAGLTTISGKPEDIAKSLADMEEKSPEAAAAILKNYQETDGRLKAAGLMTPAGTPAEGDAGEHEFTKQVKKYVEEKHVDEATAFDAVRKSNGPLYREYMKSR